MTEPASTARFALDGQVLRLDGRLDVHALGGVWTGALDAARGTASRDLVVDISGVTACDMAGAALLAAVEHGHGGKVTLQGSNERIDALLARARAGVDTPPAKPARGPGWMALLDRIGGTASGSVAYVGEVAIAALRLPQRWRMLRWREIAVHAEHAGVRSLPLVIMLGYLMGLILAFQSAIPMRRFGAEIYVINLVSISMLRELGPLLAAVILAGRTASAFAAEIGTMKVNEELDALATMGLDATTMLVLPRLIAAVLVMPAMTLVLDVAGLAGMATVMTGFGYPVVTILRQMQTATKVPDLTGGLFKAVCFGAAVAAIGCRSGMATGTGPRAVGLAATAAVVGGIVSTVLLDGLFALSFYRLGL